MPREVQDFFECLEEYFVALGIQDLKDGVLIHEATRLRALKATLGPKAEAELDGLPAESSVTYVDFKKAIEERFLPPEDDIGSICLLRQSKMREDESTKDYVARLRASAAGLRDLPEEWRIKAILASLRLTHKNGKVRDLLAEKQPETIQEAEHLAESYEIRAKDQPMVDWFNAALGRASLSLPLDGVAKGY